MQSKRRSSRPTSTNPLPESVTHPRVPPAELSGTQASTAGSGTPLLDQLGAMQTAQERAHGWIGERPPVALHEPVAASSGTVSDEAVAAASAMPELSAEQWQDLFSANAAAAHADPLAELFSTAGLSDAQLQQWIGTLRASDGMTAGLATEPSFPSTALEHHLEQVSTSSRDYLDLSTRNTSLLHLDAAIDVAVMLGTITGAPQLTRACDTAVEGLLQWLNTLVEDPDPAHFMERLELSSSGPSPELLSFIRQVGLHDLGRGQELSARLADVVQRIQAQVAAEDSSL